MTFVQAKSRTTHARISPTISPHSASAPEKSGDCLAEILRADLLLIDEAAGRAEARRRHLRVTGTFGVLRTEAEQGLGVAKNVGLRLSVSPRA